MFISYTWPEHLMFLNIDLKSKKKADQILWNSYNKQNVFHFRFQWNKSVVYSF